MNSKTMNIGRGGNVFKEIGMICMEVQKLYSMASELEIIAEHCQSEATKKKLKDFADRLIMTADNINVEMDCME